MTCRDYLGEEIREGDFVVYAAKSHRGGMSKGRVKGWEPADELTRETPVEYMRASHLVTVRGHYYRTLTDGSKKKIGRDYEIPNTRIAVIEHDEQYSFEE